MDLENNMIIDRTRTENCAVSIKIYICDEIIIMSKEK